MWESMVKYCIVKKERGETIITNHVAKLTGDQIYIKEKRFTVYALLQSKGVMSVYALLQSKGVMSPSNKSTFSNKYKSSGGIN